MLQVQPLIVIPSSFKPISTSEQMKQILKYSATEFTLMSYHVKNFKKYIQISSSQTIFGQKKNLKMKIVSD
jgi:hypothetical protein